MSHALLYAPLVYVDGTAQKAANKYVGRGMTLVSITAPSSGPQASRVTELLFPDASVQFGGFAALVGTASVESAQTRAAGDRDVYVLGMTAAGLQLARVPLDDVAELASYAYFDPRNGSFTGDAPRANVTDAEDVYLAGTFSSGSVFFSAYFSTFVMIYFNKMTDSTFYGRLLDLSRPRAKTPSRWLAGGKDGRGIGAQDVEALAWYGWSDEQVLYKSGPGSGGYNYAGVAHPEYYNRRYYADAPPFTTQIQQDGGVNGWYGDGEVAEDQAGGDGRHVLLSWTSQEHGGLYQILLARIEFEDMARNGTGSAVGQSHRMITVSSFLGFDRARGFEAWLIMCELALLVGIIVAVASVF